MPAPPDAERETQQLLEAYTEDADDWWWGYVNEHGSTCISVYVRAASVQGRLRLEHKVQGDALLLLANNYLNLLKVQQSAT